MVKVAELYVSNLPYDANADNLRAAFERAGPVRDVRLPLHRINGTCRGFAFVLMESEAIVDSVAEKMDNSTFRGRKIGVKAQRSTTNESHMELNKLLTAAASAGDVLQLFARRGADFNHVNLATCLHRLGALRGTIGDEPKAVEIMQKLLCKVESNLHAHAPDWVPRALANATWGLARVGCECDSLFESIAALSLATLESFIAQNLANTVWAFATAGFPAKELFEAVWQACVEKIATFNAQDLCNVAWAFSKAGFEAPKLFEAVSKEAAAKVSTFKPQELALMTWAFAHSKTPDAALFAVLGDEACNQAARFSPQNVANCVWAFTVQKVEHSKLYEALAAEAPKVNLNAAELSCVAWSFAAARVPATALFGAIALQSQDKIKTFQAQDLADVSWAFATAGFEAPVLFQAVANVAVSKMSTFNAKDMATTVWAFAKARVSAPTLFQAVAAEAAKKMESFSADDVASTVFAFGKMRAFHPALLEAAAVEAVSKMQNYSSSGLANLVLGFAKLGFLEPQLFDAVAEVAAGAEFDMEQLTAVVWAFAATAAADSAKARVLFDALAVVVVKKAGELNSHDLSTILCAYATAGIAAPALFDAAGGAVALKMQECGQDLSKKFRREDLSRLHQVAVHLKMEQPQHALARALQDHAESLKAAYVSGDATPVATQKHVSQVPLFVGEEIPNGARVAPRRASPR